MTDDADAHRDRRRVATSMRSTVVRAARRTPRRRSALVIGGLAVALVAAFAARVLLGDYTITVPDFFRILTGTDIPGATYILMESKLPRAVLALLAGVAFGVAGALFQTTLRNPLASPDIIGVSLGASAIAVVAIALWGWQGLPVSGVGRRSARSRCALVVRLVAGPHGGHRLILVGIGLAAAMQSVIQYVFTRVDEYDAQLVLRWLTGSVNGVAWPTIRLLALALAVLLPVTWWLCRSLRDHRARRRHRRGPGRLARPQRAPAPDGGACSSRSPSRRQDRSPSCPSSRDRSPGPSTAGGPRSSGPRSPAPSSSSRPTTSPTT